MYHYRLKDTIGSLPDMSSTTLISPSYISTTTTYCNESQSTFESTNSDATHSSINTFAASNTSIAHDTIHILTINIAINQTQFNNNHIRYTRIFQLASNIKIKIGNRVKSQHIHGQLTGIWRITDSKVYFICHHANNHVSFLEVDRHLAIIPWYYKWKTVFINIKDKLEDSFGQNKNTTIYFYHV